MDKNTIQKAIGGYFELELSSGKEYYTSALRLNTGRNSLEYILRLRHYTKVYIPYYTCEVLLEPFHKLHIDYAFYHINQDFEIADPIRLQPSEALLYTNYYGIKTQYANQLSLQYSSSLILDNTQAFYAQPPKDIDAFNTCRKFFGVPDGAYCFTNQRLDMPLQQEVSYNRTSFLLKRLDVGAEQGYNDFRQQSENLCNLPIALMSNLTQKILSSIDYHAVATKRRDNFLYLHSALGNSNQLDIHLDTQDVPMVYPYFSTKDNLRQTLIENKIFVARYWPNVLQHTNPNTIENNLTTYLLPLPIDQRYNREDMERIIRIIKENI